MTPLRRPSEAECRRWLDSNPTRLALAELEVIAAEIEAEKTKKNPNFPKAKRFTDVWTEKQWFQALHDAQHGLCAWCATKPVGHLGTIDHVRPKSAVTRYVKEAGGEIDEAGSVQGRKLLPKPLLRPAYYRLAYDPKNLVYSCERCNVSWKKTLWPVHPWLGPWSAPDPTREEVALLLDPFVPGFDPLRHFRFNNQGIIFHRDERAQITIATLGLDRATLCEQRVTQLSDIETDVQAIRRDLRDPEIDPDRVPLLRRIAARCGWSSPHAAFCRAALRAVLLGRGGSWAQLTLAWARHGVDAIDEPPSESWVDTAPIVVPASEQAASIP